MIISVLVASLLMILPSYSQSVSTRGDVRSGNENIDLAQLSVGALFRDDFEDVQESQGRWEDVSGSWNISNGVYNQSNDKAGVDAVSYAGENMTDFVIEVKINVISSKTGSNTALIIFRYVDSGNYYYFGVRYELTTNAIYLSKLVGGALEIIYLGNLPEKLSYNTWHTLKVKVNGTNIKCYIDDVLMIDRDDSQFSMGKIGLRTWEASACFDDIRVYPLPKQNPVKIQVVGSDQSALEGYMVETVNLTGAHIDANRTTNATGWAAINFSAINSFPCSAIFKLYNSDGKFVGEKNVTASGVEGIYPNDTYKIVVDKIPPVSSVLPLSQYQNSTEFAVSWSGSDPTPTPVSGLTNYTIYVSDSGAPYTVWLQNVTFTSYNFTGENGHIYYFYSRARDNAGHFEAAPMVADAATTIDAIKPTANASLVPETPNGENGWYVSNVTINLTANDNISGVKNIKYRINNASWITSPSNFTNFTISVDGIHFIEFYAVDNALNDGTINNFTIKLDKIEPSIAIYIKDNATCTKTTAVTLNLSAVDIASGPWQMCFSNNATYWSVWEDFKYSKSWDLIPWDGPKTVYFRVRDFAGWVAEPVSDTITLDTAVPKIYSTTPISGARDIPVTTSIVIEFSESMDTISVENAITIIPAMPLDYKWENENRRLIITPSKFVEGTTCTITIYEGATDTAGNSIVAAYSWSFTTTPKPGIDWGTIILIVLAVAIIIESIGSVVLLAKRKKKPKVPEVPLKKLKTESVKLKEEATCDMCFKTIKKGSSVIYCECKKVFHELCARKVGKCPVCGREL